MPAKKKTTTETKVSPASTLTVSNIQVYPLKEPLGKTKAFARVLIADQLQLTGMRIVEGVNGLFLAYPNDPSYKGEDFRSLFYPVSRELRDSIEIAVLDRYNQILRGDD